MVKNSCKDCEVTLKTSPVGESSCNGQIESQIRRTTGMTRVLKACPESYVKEEIKSDANIIPWMVRHAAIIFNSFRKDDDGRTPWEHAKGRPFSKKIAVLGESVHFLLPNSLGHDKLDSRWGSGIWLGVFEDSGEYLVGTRHGIIRCRTFKRKADPAQRWNLKEIYEMKGTLWEPSLGDKCTFKDLKPRVSFDKPSRVDKPEQPEAEEKDPKRYVFPIKKRDMKHGPTHNCVGCAALMRVNMLAI